MVDVTINVPGHQFTAAKHEKIKQLEETFGISNRKAWLLKHLAMNGKKTIHSLQREGAVVGVFGCLHAPFDLKAYLPFLKETFEARGVDTVVALGDIVDNHAISYHESDPDGLAAGNEIIAAREHLQGYYEAFPDVHVVLGNHDLLTYRKAFSAGLSKKAIRDPADIWKSPPGWIWADEVVIDNVRYVHGTAMGKCSKLVQKGGQSVAMAHWHTDGYVMYFASYRHRAFALAVGCGIDHRAYAMAYGKAFKNKPILGCGVVRGGVEAEFIPLPLELIKYSKKFEVNK